MPDMSTGLERDMPSVTPGLKDISPKPEGGHSEPAVLLVAGLTVMAVANYYHTAAVSVLCSHDGGDLL